ncbi:MAG: FliM/FliN family flagellar motor switch protein [Bdellovibrionales bacterium]|nr:FliM/FliN family flagellar motor switch protein [Bdellovibrionales bacterium]
MESLHLNDTETETDLLLELSGGLPEQSSFKSASPKLDQRDRLLTALKVEIEVNLGSLEVSASKLVDIAEGLEFEMPFDPHKPLTLSLGAEPLAEAILTRTDDGMLGLKVVRVLDEQQETNSENGRQSLQAGY